MAGAIKVPHDLSELTGTLPAAQGGVPAGGTSGQVLAKSSGTDHDTGWVDAAAGGVTSVNTRTGAVTLTKADVGLDQVDDTSDLDKPVSVATSQALSGKCDKTSNLADLTDAAAARANLGLGAADSPTFAGATIGTGTGLAKLASGVVGTATPGTDYLDPTSTLDATKLSGVAPAGSIPSTGLTLASYGGKISTATDGATVTFDLAVSNDWQITLGGNRTLATANEPAQFVGRFLVIQPATGGPYAPTFWSGVAWVNGAPTYSTTAGAVDTAIVLKRGAGDYVGYFIRGDVVVYLTPTGDGSGLTGLTESQIANLTTDLAAKAPLASPALTGTPTAPTATAGTNTTQVATTAFVTTAVAGVSGVGMAVGNAVSGGTANAVLYEDGTGNLAASANLTYSSRTLAVQSDGTNDPFRVGDGAGNALSAFGQDGTLYVSQNPPRTAYSYIKTFSGVGTFGTVGGLRLDLVAPSSYVLVRAPASFGSSSTGVAGSSPVTVSGVAAQAAPLVALTQQSSTTADRTAGVIDATLPTPTDASYLGRLALYAADFTGTNREGVRVESDGTQALLGFYGATAGAKPVITGSRGGNAALASLLSALAALGLLTDSTTA